MAILDVSFTITADTSELVAALAHLRATVRRIRRRMPDYHHARHVHRSLCARGSTQTVNTHRTSIMRPLYHYRAAQGIVERRR